MEGADFGQILVPTLVPCLVQLWKPGLQKQKSLNKKNRKTMFMIFSTRLPKLDQIWYQNWNQIWSRIGTFHKISVV
jgi:hypothetical protein